MLFQQTPHQVAVAYVALHKGVARVGSYRFQGLEIARIGQLVEIDEGRVASREPVQHEVGADKAGSAGDQNHETCLETSGECRPAPHPT